MKLSRRAVSSAKGRFLVAALCFAAYTLAKLLYNRSFADNASYLESEDDSIQSFADRDHCQIIYILGVEGSMHHGFTPLLETFATKQVDTATDEPYVITYANAYLRRALFGWKKETRPVDNPTLVRQTIRQICPHNGKRHIVIEDSSFPSGTDVDPRTYRIHRERWWMQARMEEIAMSDTAMNHPTNLYKFYEAYSPYADVKFIALHRPYVETIASHYGYGLDVSVEQHSNVIRGFMLLLRRFLDAHIYDQATGGKLWTLVCVERLTAKFYTGGDENEEGDSSRLEYSRGQILEYLAKFLGWPVQECNDCFLTWKESHKNHVEMLGQEKVALLLEHMRRLGGIWPPVPEGALEEQKCSL